MMHNVNILSAISKQNNIFHVYRPQRSWGKVMFLHVSVILFTGGVCLSACWDTTPPEQTPPGQAPPGAVHAERYGQHAGGTHPTGMHSCWRLVLLDKIFLFWFTRLHSSRHINKVWIHNFQSWIFLHKVAHQDGWLSHPHQTGDNNPNF